MVNTCLVACMRVNVEIRPRGLMAFPAAKHASGCQAETCCVVARPWCSGVHGMCRETDITFRGWSRPSRACNRRGSGGCWCLPSWGTLRRGCCRSPLALQPGARCGGDCSGCRGLAVPIHHRMSCISNVTCLATRCHAHHFVLSTHYRHWHISGRTDSVIVNANKCHIVSKLAHSLAGEDASCSPAPRLACSAEIELYASWACRCLHHSYLAVLYCAVCLSKSCILESTFPELDAIILSPRW